MGHLLGFTISRSNSGGVHTWAPLIMQGHITADCTELHGNYVAILLCWPSVQGFIATGQNVCSALHSDTHWSYVELRERLSKDCVCTCTSRLVQTNRVKSKFSTTRLVIWCLWKTYKCMKKIQARSVLICTFLYTYNPVYMAWQVLSNCMFQSK